MAREDTEEQTDEKKEKAPSSKLKLILIILLVLNLVAISAGVFIFKPWSSSDQALEADSKNLADQDKAQDQVKDGDAPANKDDFGELVELEPFIVNLISDDEDRYLKAVIVLQVSSKEGSEELTSKKAQVKDAVITVLSSITKKEALSSTGRYDLKLEIVKRANSILTKGIVREIFFTEYVVQ